MYIEVSDVSKTIKGIKVLDHITLSLSTGKIYGIQGKNGSGKTMLLRAISGLIFPDQGKVMVDQDILGKDRDFPKDIGILIGYPDFVPYLSALDNLKQLNRIRKRSNEERLYEVLQDVGLEDAGDKIFRRFSMGMKQKLGIAAALMDHPKLLILDEPTNALDRESVAKLRNLLIKEKERGSCILLSSHDKEEIEALSDEVIQMEDGKIIESFAVDR